MTTERITKQYQLREQYETDDTELFICRQSHYEYSVIELFNFESVQHKRKRTRLSRKREQFQKFYDNRDQLIKIYVKEKNQNNQKNDEQSEFFEDIDLAKKNDRDDQND
jgi:hypothetical protein